jgi:uncharacterized damage-inducible protein DinB
MISPAHAKVMARYNAWQNQSLYNAANGLADEARRLDRGAFFGSIHGTLSHLLWADAIWMHRLAGTAKPEGNIPDSARLIAAWDELSARRAEMDTIIVRWAEGLSEDWLAGSLSWHSKAAGRDVSKPRWFLAAHVFNHQTHHRGQVHAMLTAAGARPADTDLFLLPEQLAG